MIWFRWIFLLHQSTLSQRNSSCVTQFISQNHSISFPVSSKGVKLCSGGFPKDLVCWIKLESTRIGETKIDSAYILCYSCGKTGLNLMFRISVWVKSNLPDTVYEVRVWNSSLKWKLSNNDTTRDAGVKQNGAIPVLLFHFGFTSERSQEAVLMTSVLLEMRDKNRMNGSLIPVAAGHWLDSLNCSRPVKSSQQFAACWPAVGSCQVTGWLWRLSQAENDQRQSVWRCERAPYSV